MIEAIEQLAVCAVSTQTANGFRVSVFFRDKLEAGLEWAWRSARREARARAMVRAGIAV
jgi:hypothetical protein